MLCFGNGCWLLWLFDVVLCVLGMMLFDYFVFVLFVFVCMGCLFV